MHTIRDGKVYNDETGKLAKNIRKRQITYDEDDNVVVMRALQSTFAEFGDEEPKDWLIEGVIALNEADLVRQRWRGQVNSYR